VGLLKVSLAVFVVRDDGDGIDAADRARIFERFERLAGHETIAGTGLGLPIARDLARRMGGDLDVASVAGSGSAFVLVLPGPAPVPPATLATALEVALAGEEQGLEERAVPGAIPAGPEPTGIGQRRAFPGLSPRSDRARHGQRPVPVDG
jgi:hypothetical protein